MAAICMLNRSLNLYRCFRCSSSLDFASDAMAVAVVGRKGKMNKPRLPPINCSAPLERSPEVQQQFLTEEEAQEEFGILCEPCNGRGWLLCDFCEGKKNNVKAENSRIYRRCLTCKAVGYILCSECKVFKCITFPDYSDGEL
ncbi:uncharacterized protein LOC121971564 [Zingiber officinale]|uniref:Uncharacterized protein n=1 Tax=Zingiber officinale TaxID=94328 RepID=A0A8J5LFT9_ZINOF|nr:uncharacterized protein LOC121971564 [Zingiber officinale]KAG6516094.1 hypothetical protein ZIOFF_026542 [Zingiber officinale]